MLNHVSNMQINAINMLQHASDMLIHASNVLKHASSHSNALLSKRTVIIWRTPCLFLPIY